MAEALRYDLILPGGQPLRWDMGPDFLCDGDVPANRNAAPRRRTVSLPARNHAPRRAIPRRVPSMTPAKRQ